MKICEHHNDKLKSALELQGFPRRSHQALFDAQTLIYANALDKDPQSFFREGCPICQRPTVKESLEWIEQAAKAIAWKNFQESVEAGKVKIN